MSSISEESIVLNCPHCDTKSFALKFPLWETNNFLVTCDVHPLTKGHLLIMPKEHFSCIGEYPSKLLDEFLEIYKMCSGFIYSTYGSVSSFEHGIIGQTVFHSHVQMFPYAGSQNDIVTEGASLLTAIKSIHELKTVFKNEKMYLFFSIGKNMWIVNTSIGKPRFFRDRFAKALLHPERGNWKIMRTNASLMSQAYKEIAELTHKWKLFLSTLLSKGQSTFGRHL